MKKGKPKFKKGDICVFQCPGFENEPEEWKEIMEIEGNPNWYPYENHPNGGYWQYPIKDKANECPENLLKLRVVLEEIRAEVRKKVYEQKFLVDPDRDTIIFAKELARKYKIKYQEILAGMRPNGSIRGKVWDSTGKLVSYEKVYGR